MPGISIDVTCHELNVDPTFKPIKQKRRKLGPERSKTINDEVERLLKVGSIAEAKYPDWLAIPVVVKKKNGKWRFEWDERCEAAFEELKSYLASPPVLAKPVEGEPLFLYIAVSATAVSGVLIREERSEQKSIFYVSQTLTDAETRYPQIEKVALAVVVSARKMRPYFQSHSIIVLATLPLRSILHSPSQSGRLAKWVIELNEYNIEYRNRSSAKSQVLGDFLIKLPTEVTTEPTPDEIWTLHVDGLSSKHGSGIGICLTSPTGEILEQSFRLNFHTSNNEAEYEALIAGLQLAHGNKVWKIRVFCDSQLVANQFNGEYEAKDGRMGAYLRVVQDLVRKFDEFELTRIPREEVEGVRLINPPEEEPENGEAITVEEDALLTKLEYGCDKEWLGVIRVYIADGEIPSNKWEDRKLRAQAARYVLVDGEVFKWRFLGLLMTCVEGPEARKIMHEVHSGACGNHSSGRSLAIKIK
ncbi:uncharacterized protein LOC112084483 [Eutrema salsugineum]|uniref:uncharacterized protein LOC112084483 n=1 Tax=Eutrema salsugineum TaxID=72664 RepID=UPI000CED2932|nr:uncharacterized protein LOC112084483 [Eutrema salsugineum]